MLNYLTSNYGWLLGLGGAGAIGVAWALGLPALLRIVASIVEVLTPMAKTIMEWLVSGLKDIMDSMATILTVVLLCYGVHVYDKVHATINHNRVATQLQVCQAENTRITKSKTPVKEPELWEFPFRWSW